MGDVRTLDTGTEHLLGRVEDGVAVISFNRPERRNALHPEMYDGFDRLLPVLAEDAEVGALVVTGVGGAFCAGGDVRAMDEGNSGGSPRKLSFEERVTDLRRRQRSVSAALNDFPKVTIAALPGPAAGAGLSIALACDLRIAAQRAVITTAFAKVGFSGDFGGSWFLTQMLGAAKARELYLTSDRLTAADAERLGVVNKVLADEDFDAAALAYARGFAQGPVVAYRYIKENINRAVGADLRTCLDAEAVAMSRTAQTEDHREAARAFVEKRNPHFVGH